MHSRHGLQRKCGGGWAWVGLGICQVIRPWMASPFSTVHKTECDDCKRIAMIAQPSRVAWHLKLHGGWVDWRCICHSHGHDVLVKSYLRGWRHHSQPCIKRIAMIAQPSRVATLGLPGTPTTDLSLKAGEGTKASHLSLSPSHHNSLRQTHTVRRNLMLLRTALGQSNFNGISP